MVSAQGGLSKLRSATEKVGKNGMIYLNNETQLHARRGRWDLLHVKTDTVSSCILDIPRVLSAIRRGNEILVLTP